MQQPTNKHPSFNSRPIPTFQLLAKVSKFTGQRKDAVHVIPPSANQDSATPSQQLTSVDNSDGFPRNEKTNLIVAESKFEAKQPPLVTTTQFPNKQTMGTLGSILSGTNVNSSETHEGPSKRILGNTYSNLNNSLIGGQPPEGDPYQSTLQYSSEGSSAALDKRSLNCKKMLSQVDPQQMVSPITGELVGDYGTWADDLAKKRNGQASDSSADAPKTEEDPIMAKLKAQLAGRGAKGVIGLGRLFKIMDDDGSNSLSFAEFKKAMKECRMELSDTELVLLFKRFDRMNSGAISYNDFLRTVTGSLNPKRRALVNLAFDVLDKDGSGQIDLADIALAYDVSMHPDFKAGHKTKDQVLLEFLEGFDVGGSRDGVVTREEFANYYTNISSSIDKDDYFELMIRNAWHISGGEGVAANTANRRVLVTRADGSQYVEEIRNDLGLRSGDKAGMTARLKGQGVHAADVSQFDGGEDNKQQFGKQPSRPRVTSAKSPQKGGKFAKTAGHTPIVAAPSPGIQMIINRIKDAMKARGAGGFVGLQRRFRIMDDDGSKSLSLAEFKKAMKECKLDLSEPDLRQLFAHFDTDQSGSIDFEEFVQGVRDPLTERRLKLVKLAFNILDKDGSGCVDGTEIASMYDASKHPEVLSKRKTPAQVLREFLDTFDVGGVKDGMVTEPEFVNYYTNLSANIDNEDYFELMIRNAWHISGGEGVYENSSNMKVLVTDFAGNERTVALQNDLGLKPDDLNGIYGRLTRQGVSDIMAINGKMLKKVNVNGVDIVTAQGTVSAILKDEGSKVSRAPPFSRNAANSSSTPAVKPLTMTNNRSTNSSKPNASSLNLSGSRLSGETNKSRLAQQLHGSLQQQSTERQQAAVSNIVGDTLLDVVRVQLLARGTGGIIDLQRKFAEMDRDGSKSLDRAEFSAAIRANALTFSDAQLATLFDHFDTDKSGTIDYNELLSGLRGQLPPKVLVLVHKAFDLMDSAAVDWIDPQQLLRHFDPTRHPDVLTGSRTSEEVLREFLDTFDVGAEQEGRITRDEFVTYYTNISAALGDTDYLELVLQKTWHLGEDFRANADKLRSMQGGQERPQSSLAAKIKQAQTLSDQLAQPERSNNSWDDPPRRRPSSASAVRRPSYGTTNGSTTPHAAQAYRMGHLDPSPPATLGSDRPRSAGSVSMRGRLSVSRPVISEEEALEELKALQTRAVLLYNQEDYEGAEAKFGEVLEAQQLLLPSNHPECLKTEKSLQMVRKRIEAARHIRK